MNIHTITALQPSPFDAWVAPSVGNLVFFLLIILAIVIAWFVAIQKAGFSRWHWLWPIGALALSALAQGSSWIRQDSMPPPVPVFMGVHLVVVITLVLSPAGKKLAMSLPMAWLVGFHAFRLPLELWLHRAHSEGTIPVQMTFAGHNFDIVTGVLALAGWLWLRRRPDGPLFVPWVLNCIGFALLVAVGVIAMRSVPYPFRAYQTEPALMLPMHFPYGWIVTMAVASALVFHGLLFRRLLMEGNRRRSAAAIECGACAA